MSEKENTDETMDRGSPLVALRNYQHFFLPAGEDVRSTWLFSVRNVPFAMLQCVGALCLPVVQHRLRVVGFCCYANILRQVGATGESPAPRDPQPLLPADKG
ncbi:hypothetical protein O3P69_017762 [Scylla paramamosain]|uniref:Uncharacterized protein n=1 Tax=Scylla paramamosain TaxID=85552 RepID=A0AAW0SC45_SCYPA